MRLASVTRRAAALRDRRLVGGFKLLPVYTAALGAAGHVANPQKWVSAVNILYTIGTIVAYMASGFIIDAIGRRSFLFSPLLLCEV